MEPDDIRTAWQALDRRLERQLALDIATTRERAIDRARSSLRPLLLGQILQMLLGVATVAFAAMLWSTRPTSVPVIVAGVLVHGYGIVAIVSGGVMIAAIRGLDFARSVVDAQRALERVRRRAVISTVVAGLPWWLLWVAVLIVLFALGGFDLYAREPLFVGAGLAAGVAGIAATLAFHRWAQDPKRPRLARALGRAIEGTSLRRARERIGEIDAFGRE